MPIAHEKSESTNRYCQRLQYNLEKCMKKNKIQTECDYFKKVLQICQKRPKKIYREGP